MRHVTSALLAGAALVVVAGCGGSNGGYGSGPPMGGGGPPPPQGASASVTVADYSFTPNALTVKVGTTVTWTNTGAASHTVSADDGTWGGGPLQGTGGGMYGGGGAGGSYARTFSAAGTFTYHCAIHPTMTGSVTVTP